MKMSETITELATALAKAQGAMEDASKSETNPHFKSKYADLAAVREVVRVPLAANDLSVVQAARTNASEVEVETMLLHKSGEYIAETLSLPVSKRDAQGIGSAISYGRRYGLMSLLGLAAADDDGNAAVARPPQKAEPARLSAEESETVFLVMRDTLFMCESPDSLKAWVAANRATKAQLLPEHQEAISDAYKARLAEVMNPPLADAAE